MANSHIETELIAAARSHAGAIAEFTEELVAIPSENPPGNHYPECVEVIQRRLNTLGWSSRVLDVPGEQTVSPRAILLAGPDDDRPVVVFHGHYDVVPADDRQQFTPMRNGNRLVGRGTADMKGGVAAMIYAATAARDLLPEISEQLALVIVPDEETGGVLGSGYLQQQGLLGRNTLGMLTPEPTSGVVWYACRGALTLWITVRGRYAHVGQHYSGINAFEQMLRVAGALADLKQEVSARNTRHALDSEPDPERARESILMMGGLVQGGTAFNAVPASCSFTVERRFNPEEDREVERARVFALFDELRSDGIELDVEILQDAPSAASPVDDPLADALQEAAEQVLGKKPRFEMCPGLLETRWYAQEGVPAYAFGPGLLSVAHGPDEYVDLDMLADFAAIYALSAVNRLRPLP